MLALFGFRGGKPLVFTARKQAGYHIDDADIVADKREARRKV
jgi:hypothetical protein